MKNRQKNKRKKRGSFTCDNNWGFKKNFKRGYADMKQFKKNEFEFYNRKVLLQNKVE